MLILNRGRLVADSPTEKVGTDQGSLVKVSFAPGAVRLDAKTIQTAMEALEGIQRVSRQQSHEAEVDSFEVLATRDVRGDLFQLAVDKGLKLYELSRETSSLEEVFRRLTLGKEEPKAQGGQDQQQRPPNP